jgi:hypothetical protein
MNMLRRQEILGTQVQSNMGTKHTPCWVLELHGSLTLVHFSWVYFTHHAGYKFGFLTHAFFIKGWGSYCDISYMVGY